MNLFQIFNTVDIIRLRTARPLSLLIKKTLLLVLWTAGVVVIVYNAICFGKCSNDVLTTAPLFYVFMPRCCDELREAGTIHLSGPKLKLKCETFG